MSQRFCYSINMFCGVEKKLKIFCQRVSRSWCLYIKLSGSVRAPVICAVREHMGMEKISAETRNRSGGFFLRKDQ
ncbi:hypothetical protein XELAEV_18010631mg [Xenopus laevis]|uniref:Uncharacterized protein n=1 Tax=Xenopus laevis TaxID=8355 RepID=A0A974DUI0_XENLA|nr:hypothetical protein XELAEV_18010631mg [Xenopus laevis]